MVAHTSIVVHWISTLLRLLLNVTLSLVVLACPATGGMCCGDADGFSDQVLKSPACGKCCCGHNDAEDSESPQPSHDQCQSCFCAGALPTCTSASVNRAATEVVEFVPLNTADANAIVALRSLDRHIDHAPPYGRLLLAMNCTLLL